MTITDAPSAADLRRYREFLADEADGVDLYEQHRAAIRGGTISDVTGG